MEELKNSEITAADTKPKNRTITIKVKAKGLFEKGSLPGESDVDDKTEIKNDGGKTSDFGKDKSDFKTGVWIGNTVTWSIKQEYAGGKDDGYNVELNSIEQTGSNFFGTQPLTPVNGVITGTVEKGSTGDDTYKIHFTITNNGTTNKYTIDPKLQINQ